MSAHHELFNKMHGTRVRVSCNLDRLSFLQAQLFERIHREIVEYDTDLEFAAIVGDMCNIGMDCLKLKGADQPRVTCGVRTPHDRLHYAGYITCNQSVIIRLIEDAIVITFGPRSDDSAWEQSLVVTIDRVKEDHDEELQIPSIDNLYYPFELLCTFVAGGSIELPRTEQYPTVTGTYQERPVVKLLQSLGASPVEYLAKPAVGKALSELANRTYEELEAPCNVSYSPYPITREDFGRWKLDISSENAKVKEILIDDIALLHHFHPKAVAMRIVTAHAKIKDIWENQGISDQ